MTPETVAAADATFASRLRARRDGWRAAVRVYGDRRVLALLFLGFSSGLPFGALAEPLTAWLSEAGVGKAAIGAFALLSLPYSLKFVWAPFVDRLALPVLSRRFGRRRAWALTAQAAVCVALLALGVSDPADRLLLTAVCAALVAFASATQDVVLDAYRVESLDERRMAAGAATMVFGWRVGQLGAAAVGLLLAEVLPWSAVFALLALLMPVGMLTILLGPEPVRRESPEALALQARAEAFLERRPGLPARLAHVLGWLYAACVCPFLEFLGRRGWLPILAFVMFYKFGDALLGVMKVPFLLEIGFSKADIAEVVKLFGFVATIAGGFIGGLVVARAGLFRGLLVCGLLMAASNLVFVAQAYAGADRAMLALTISIENVTTGMGITAFVAYMSSLCNVAYTATQYALLTSLMALSRTVLASGAGWLAERVSWPEFFVLTTLAALPGLVLLIWIIRTTPRPGRTRCG
jgi:PAT family beta-lactamase induction signal transducer AmpG